MKRKELSIACVTIVAFFFVHRAYSSEAESPLRMVRHTKLSAETLTPVTEASIWQSRCRPADDDQLKELLRQMERQSLSRMEPAQYSPLHVRVAMYDPPLTIFVDAGLVVKIVDAISVQYFSVKSNPRLFESFVRIFDNCN